MLVKRRIAATGPEQSAVKPIIKDAVIVFAAVAVILLIWLVNILDYSPPGAAD